MSQDVPQGEGPVLRVRDLRIHYATARGDLPAVRGMDLDVMRGEIVGLVGESGCGKTTAAMGILRLVQPPGRIVAGSVLIRGKEIMTANRDALRRLRWREIALIPQGAMNSLNPVMRVSDQMADVIRTHERGVRRAALRDRILGLLRSVDLPERVYPMYPHELSGGMKQRVCIAMAIALEPPFIIADEPTSALDVVVQRKVSQTLLSVKDRLGASMLVIGHDMALMAQLVDRIVVMYAGSVVEVAPVLSLFEDSLHPYTRLLIEAVPSIKDRKPLRVTEGLTQDLVDAGPGCIFRPRCDKAMPLCSEIAPKPVEVKPKHLVACHLFTR